MVDGVVPCLLLFGAVVVAVVVVVVVAVFVVVSVILNAIDDDFVPWGSCGFTLSTITTTITHTNSRCTFQQLLINPTAPTDSTRPNPTRPDPTRPDPT